MVHRFLITGTDDRLMAFHIPVCMLLNAIERREQTVLYTCFDEDRKHALEVAKKAGVTVEEWDGKTWAVIVQGEHPGWGKPQSA